MNCVNCGEGITKYRCKKCPELTCSLICHNKHENYCVSEPVDNKIATTTSEQLAYSVPFKTEDTVEPQKLNELGKDEKLKELLHNPYLREYLLQIDKSPNAWKAMKIAMLEPLFIEFANECLNIVEPDL